MLPAAELIPFPRVPLTRQDTPEATPPGERAVRLRKSDSDTTLDRELAKSEALLFVDMGLLLDELLRIGGRDFALTVVSMHMAARGFVLVGSEG